MSCEDTGWVDGLGTRGQAMEKATSQKLLNREARALSLTETQTGAQAHTHTHTREIGRAHV